MLVVEGQLSFRLERCQPIIFFYVYHYLIYLIYLTYLMLFTRFTIYNIYNINALAYSSQNRVRIIMQSDVKLLDFSFSRFFWIWSLISSVPASSMIRQVIVADLLHFTSKGKKERQKNLYGTRRDTITVCCTSSSSQFNIKFVRSRIDTVVLTSFSCFFVLLIKTHKSFVYAWCKYIVASTSQTMACNCVAPIVKFW